MQQRWLRAPCAIGMGSFAAYLLNLGIMRTVYLNDLKDLKLDKYFELDLDAEMMRTDLK